MKYSEQSHHIQTSNSRMQTQIWTLFVWASLSEAFNIDTEHPLRFNGTPEDFFGYSVYQTEFGNRKQIIVGAPLQGNLRGEIYSCTADLQSCKQLQRPGSESVRFIGIEPWLRSNLTSECTMREVNVVFLFDGSSSMKAHEFQMNKDFIKNVMKELSDSSIKTYLITFF
ncbi:integrin alpha-L-like [Labeo rohita]|uniref:integrin alpha-L-like n=1 Tax=Labeo rohita TaxID=84645 RepID=UPI0021E2D6EF|nr:integrin alpha-L-like [Labeo rohita]